MNQTAFRNFLNCERIYEPNEITEVLKEVRPYFRFAYTNRSERYFNVPCSFDIETSSFFHTCGKADPEKVAIMYEWTFGIFGAVIVGRTWEEFTTMLSTLAHELGLTLEKRLICYVHNLGHEFQYFRKWLNWKKVFSIDTREPIYALTWEGVEFRCSYLLSGYRLELLGEQLQTYNVRKLMGNLDYDKIRHNQTPLTSNEIAYCVNDVKVVMAYIAERIEIDGNIAKIPLTKTGYVRNYCRASCFYEEGKRRKESFKRARYAEIMKALQLTVPEYQQLKRAFQGGFTHANPFYSGRTVENVTSYDFTSSYPAVMLSEKFPMGKGETVVIESKEELEKNLRLYCCVFDIEFFGLESIFFSENYISVSRCRDKQTVDINNGRVVSAKHITTTITEQDFLIIQKMYKWEKIRIYNFRRYKKDYLPTDFVKAILKLYRDKTTLKDVTGKEIQYSASKEMLNACYGMCVTDIIRDLILYIDDWVDKENLPPIDYEAEIAKYNNNRGRFLFYPWGVWVTAYARRNLFTAILEFESDYLYSDTDSVKVINVERHTEYLRAYNERITAQLQTAMKHHGIDPDEIAPSTIEGVKKPLGVWDFDGHYSRFKTLGAKRYMVEYSEDSRNKPKNRGKINITVSGLNKQKCVPFLLEKAKNNKGRVFELFKDGLYIPPEYTGKLTHTYIDEEKRGTVTDYLGNPAPYYEKSSVHLMKQEYNLDISEEYATYLLGIKDIEY